MEAEEGSILRHLDGGCCLCRFQKTSVAVEVNNSRPSLQKKAVVNEIIPSFFTDYLVPYISLYLVLVVQLELL